MADALIAVRSIWANKRREQKTLPGWRCGGKDLIQQAIPKRESGGQFTRFNVKVVSGQWPWEEVIQGKERKEHELSAWVMAAPRAPGIMSKAMCESPHLIFTATPGSLSPLKKKGVCCWERPLCEVTQPGSEEAGPETVEDPFHSAAPHEFQKPYRREETKKLKPLCF